MKKEELKNLSKSELLEKEKGLYAELAKLNAQRYAGNVEKPHSFALVKKDIARIKTILNSVKNDAEAGGVGGGTNEKKDK
ncbi:MAG: 50S ribosomal protein L29 [Candidatus Omnitrophica bacterium]|jgi:ribosomal protein L29|nr:50S ribosomal protein L29 [Candidatus Omnitrophota bacterium]MDD3274414.1 50S ribosomal protein L29 [Candidatus Omnitrophota bacterium]MDD5724617.1 50S ribosomal protein L29 [Candidatus Omnitrophota bacterium]